MSWLPGVAPFTAKAHAIAAVVLVAAIAAAGFGVWVWGAQVGGARADARHEADKAEAVRLAHEAYAEQLRLGNRYAADLQGRLRSASLLGDRLSKELAHAPRFVQTACGDAIAAPASAGDPGAVQFTLAAVRLWNSALAGADVPAGACGADAAAAGACAAAAGVTVEDAFANAVENGRRFSACLTQLNTWIDYEEARAARHATQQGQP